MDLEALRALHAPSTERYASSYRPECHGCDADGYEVEYPDWPCRTALLLWDENELAEVAAEWLVWAERERAKPRPAPQGPSFIPQAWTGQLLAQMEGNKTFWEKLRSDTETATVRRVADELLPEGPFNGIEALRDD